MRHRIFHGLMIATLTLAVSNIAVFAGPYEDGQKAFIRGDYEIALQLWRPLAEKGNTDAQFYLGLLYAVGNGVTQDYKEAVKWYRLAADRGNALAQSMLGAMYAEGKVVTQDHKEAVKWYRLAAAQGDPNAQINLGELYERGEWVARDYKEATKWYRLAADRGNAHAQFNLGVLYGKGHGVAQDYKEAAKWYRLAASQGNAHAQFNLALMYDDGHGVAQDYKEAAKWYRLAASQGHIAAQFNLGVMYGKGQGVTQDFVRAHMWFNIAASQGDTDGGKNRDHVATRMNQQQIAEAQTMAKTCEASNYEHCGEPQGDQSIASATSVPMIIESGIYVVPVLINDAITLNFVVDSGAADVSIPADVITTLKRTGTLRQSDFLEEKTYVLADGSKVPSQTFRIRSLKVGNKVLQNVNGSVASVQGSLLLGQSFLSRFKSWSVDNGRHALLLSE